MKKTILINVWCISLAISSICLAEEKNQKATSANNLKFKDPFVSQLPIRATVKPQVELSSAPVVEKQRPPEITPPSLQITGLVWDTNRPQAIVNSQVVGIGDTIENVTITEITRKGIGVNYMGKYFMINPNQQTAQLNKKLSPQELRRIH